MVEMTKKCNKIKIADIDESNYCINKNDYLTRYSINTNADEDHVIEEPIQSPNLHIDSQKFEYSTSVFGTSNGKVKVLRHSGLNNPNYY